MKRARPIPGKVKPRHFGDYHLPTGTDICRHSDMDHQKFMGKGYICTVYSCPLHPDRIETPGA